MEEEVKKDANSVIRDFTSNGVTGQRHKPEEDLKGKKGRRMNEPLDKGLGALERRRHVTLLKPENKFEKSCFQG